MAFLSYEKTGHVVVLTMNRPEWRNALSGPEPIEDFVAACARIDADRSVRAVILTGAGTCFSAGGDLKTMHRVAKEGQPSPGLIRSNFMAGIQRIPQALYHLEVPIIAAVNGPAIGAGLDLACMCDLRIGSTQASFANSFVKLGLIPGDGGAWLLPRLIGRAAASRLAFTGETIDATEALRLGVLEQVVEPDVLMASAQELAQKIAANPGSALRLAKRLIRESDNGTLDQVLKSSAALQAIAHHAPAHLEALTAIVEKRSPEFGDE